MSYRDGVRFLRTPLTSHQQIERTITEGEIKAAIEKHLWQAIDLMAATLIKPDPRIWDMLLIYRPKDDANGEQER